MISDDGTRKLMAIADRLERASLADRRDPERPYLERGELAGELRELVQLERRLVPPVRRASFGLGIRRIAGRDVSVVAKR